jgi:hypothetical protein
MVSAASIAEEWNPSRISNCFFREASHRRNNFSIFANVGRIVRSSSRCIL